MRPTRCATIAAALVASVGGQASAAGLVLQNAIYFYSVVQTNFGLPPHVKKDAFSTPMPATLQPFPVTDFLLTKGIGGTVRGDYFVFASNFLDEAAADIIIKAAPDGFATIGSLGLLATTDFQFGVIVKPSRHPPPTIFDVPIIASAHGAVETDDYVSSASASVVFNDEPAPIEDQVSCAVGDPPPCSKDFYVSTKADIPIGVPTNVYKIATVTTAAIASDGNSYISDAAAGVDPTIEIDPSFAYADDFELVYSPGYVPSGGAVPEPATWTLLAAGFIALGVVRRRMTERLSPTAG